MTRVFPTLMLPRVVSLPIFSPEGPVSSLGCDACFIRAPIYLFLSVLALLGDAPPKNRTKPLVSQQNGPTHNDHAEKWV